MRGGEGLKLRGVQARPRECPDSPRQHSAQPSWRGASGVVNCLQPQPLAVPRFEDGRREVRFANGTEKHVLPGGATLVRFGNGDVKKTLRCGTVEYFYREVDTWHTTSPAGVEVRAG